MQRAPKTPRLASSSWLERLTERQSEPGVAKLANFMPRLFRLDGESRVRRVLSIVGNLAASSLPKQPVPRQPIYPVITSSLPALRIPRIIKLDSLSLSLFLLSLSLACASRAFGSNPRGWISTPADCARSAVDLVSTFIAWKRRHDVAKRKINRSLRPPVWYFRRRLAGENVLVSDCFITFSNCFFFGSVTRGTLLERLDYPLGRDKLNSADINLELETIFQQIVKIRISFKEIFIDTQTTSNFPRFKYQKFHSK